MTIFILCLVIATVLYLFFRGKPSDNILEIKDAPHFTCKNCDNIISRKAPTCPSCGHPNKASKNLSATQVITCLIFVGFMFYFLISLNSHKNEADNSSAAAHVENDPIKIAEELAACKKDLSCWAEKNISEAGWPCQKSIEKLSRYDLKWTDSLLVPKYSYYRWANKKKNIVTYIGDKVQLQNTFGAYENYYYECDYDATNRKVLDARVYSGRIPNS